ncbi:hypothetical protein GLOIN_2v1798346 [Rhizophagus clarus]|uniref:Uncharacterized protein n=1 Tax=Rhizophagus clarus TaxID=94130 RepID=A0A8H3M3G7_9GLOM|nr:hypothetical protein GLOIN_2v1798346 [Rhizophagus clarus]
MKKCERIVKENPPSTQELSHNGEKTRYRASRCKMSTTESDSGDIISINFTLPVSDVLASHPPVFPNNFHLRNLSSQCRNNTYATRRAICYVGCPKSMIEGSMHQKIFLSTFRLPNCRMFALWGIIMPSEAPFQIGPLRHFARVSRTSKEGRRDSLEVICIALLGIETLYPIIALGLEIARFFRFKKFQDHLKYTMSTISNDTESCNSSYSTRSQTRSQTQEAEESRETILKENIFLDSFLKYREYDLNLLVRIRLDNGTIKAYEVPSSIHATASATVRGLMFVWNHQDFLTPLVLV